jgi:alpha-beta hydrolase superfamily lysophospholipase
MRTLLVVTAILGVPLVLVGLAVAFGGPRAPPPMASISNPFRTVDFSSLPARARFQARDGHALAYRRYAPAGPGSDASVVLVHGSSASSESMHPLALALARAGFATYSLDVRGHGDSGAKGRIGYLGQLEDDLEDFVAAVGPGRPRTLIGFSSGGGFALRFAADDRQALFDRYLLLSPFVHQDAATARPGSGGWVGVGVPRLVALAVLNRLGVTAFNDLPVNAFALDATQRELLTPTYSYMLAANFRPHDDYRGDIRHARQPMEVLVGQDDEVFASEHFASVFEEAGRPTRVTVVPGVGHVDLTLLEPGLSAIVASLGPRE